jgi:hypothetical protein
MAARRDHQMSVVVGIAIEHHKRERPCVEHQPAAARDRTQPAKTEDAFARMLLRSGNIS